MIISGADNKDVVITGNSNVQDMAMKIDHKAFSILIDKLYSRKSEAIIRELCSNACDAHVAAGIQHIPYDLILPTVANPDLIVRDYGAGLSKDDVVYYLGTLFGSKSSESNSAIGGFGLGAKSPFCMVDSYHITSYHDGLKHNFFYVREKGGVPKFVHLSTSPTDEKSGIKFTVNMEDKNMRGWAEIAQKTLALFEVKPNCNITLEYPEVDNIFDTGVEVINNEDHRRVIACMGGVLYPIETSHNDIIRLDSYYDRLVSRKTILLRFNIGDLDVAPSREALEYTDKTIINVNKKMQIINDKKHEIVDELGVYVDEHLKVSPIDKLLNTYPVSMFRLNHKLTMFSDDEIKKYPQLKTIFNDPKTLQYANAIGEMSRLVFRTKANRSFGNINKVVVNDTSHSYLTVESQLPTANVVKFVRSVDVDVAHFFLSRLCDYKFGMSNYTIEYFSDLYVKPTREAKLRKQSIGFVPGVRDVNDRKILKENLDVSEMNIVYGQKDVVIKCRMKNADFNISPVYANTIMRHVIIDEEEYTPIYVTESAIKRLGLETAKNAICINEYAESLMLNEEFIRDCIKRHVCNRLAVGVVIKNDYKFSHNLIAGFLNYMPNRLFLNENNIDFIKSNVKECRRKMAEKLYGDKDEIDVSSYIDKNTYNNYTTTAYYTELLMRNVKVDSADVFKMLDKEIDEMSLSEICMIL